MHFSFCCKIMYFVVEKNVNIHLDKYVKKRHTRLFSFILSKKIILEKNFFNENKHSDINLE